MDFSENTYYGLNKTLMCLAGIWPYQEFKTRIPRIIINYGFLCLTIASLTAKFFTIKYDIDEIIDILSFLIPNLCYFIGYVTFHCNLEKIKLLFDWLKLDWMILQNQEEIAILKNYAMKSRKITVAMIAIFYIFSSFIILTYTLPMLLDVVMPLNETRTRKFAIPVKMYDKIEDSSFKIILIIPATMVSGIVALSVYSGFLIGIFHTCGMLNVTGYILEHAFVRNEQYLNPNEEYEMIRKKIVQSIRCHIRTIKFFEYLKDVSEICYTLQMALALILVGADYIKIMQLDKKTLTKEMDKTIMFVFHVIGILFSLFINCHAGQAIIDHSVEIFHKTTTVPWYLASTRIQRSAILILIRSQVPCYIGVGKTFVSSYEFFASLLKTSMSCATVCYSMQ